MVYRFDTRCNPSLVLQDWRHGSASSRAGLEYFFSEALTATDFDAVREFFDVTGVVLGKLSAFNGFKSRANISAECLNTLIAFAERPETFANDFTCMPVLTLSLTSYACIDAQKDTWKLRQTRGI